jgi:probable phosphoglycerate mutase
MIGPGASAPHTIWFVRHGETVWNAENRLQGRTDSPLTERGREHAAENARTLRECVPDIAALSFVASPLGRARASMEIIREGLGLPGGGYAVDERLAEMGVGAWEGLTLKDVRSTQADVWAAREAAKWTYVPPGGESYAQVAARLTDWANGLTGDVVVVAHGAVGRILRGLNLGLAKDRIPFFDTPDHDRVYRLCRGTEAVF